MKVTNPFSPTKQGSGDAEKDDGQCKTTALHFTPEEDRLLKLGIEKHCELEFQNGRTTAALKRRAVSRTFLSRK